MRQPEAVPYRVVISLEACRACVGAAVFEDLGPVRWAARRPVVTLPAHRDVPNAGQISGELLSVISGGVRALIADMTATIWCDHAGAGAVVRALAASPAQAGTGSQALPHCDGQARPVEQEPPQEAAT
jgi:hypothetical protein